MSKARQSHNFLNCEMVSENPYVLVEIPIFGLSDQWHSQNFNVRSTLASMAVIIQEGMLFAYRQFNEQCKIG
jgi:hypothetical protein